MRSLASADVPLENLAEPIPPFDPRSAEGNEEDMKRKMVLGNCLQNLSSSSNLDQSNVEMEDKDEGNAAADIDNATAGGSNDCEYPSVRI